MKKLLFTFALMIATAITANAQEAKQDSVKPKKEKKTYVISELTKVADDDQYGYTPEKPIKVGSGSRSGPQNQHEYLRLLRDAKGKPISYERKGSCCAYPSENGLFGAALLDRYEVTYRNAKGRKKKTILYISFYDYEEPMIPKGFRSESLKEVGF